MGELDILRNCTAKSTGHSTLSMQTNNQLHFRTSNEELLKHKVRYLDKELAISNSKLAKYQRDGMNKSMEEYSHSMERQNLVIKQQIEDMKAEGDALIIKSNNPENIVSSCSRRTVQKKYQKKNF